MKAWIKKISVVVLCLSAWMIAGMALAQPALPQGAVILSDNWRFKPVKIFSSEYLAPAYDDSGWLTVKVPSQWQSYPGLERHQGRGVYRLRFDFENQFKMFVYHLRFGGVFYKANVFLNGRKLGGHEGYFEPFEFEVSDLLQPRDNLLVVEVECLQEKSLAARRQVLGVFDNRDMVPSHHNPGGIWRPVSIVATGPAWLGNVRFTTISIGPAPFVRIEAEALGAALPGLAANFTLKPDNFSGRSYILSARVAGGKAFGEYYLEGAQLWWTHDRGFPACYQLTVELTGTSESFRKTMALPGAGPAKPNSDERVYVAPSTAKRKDKGRKKSGEPVAVSPLPMLSMLLDRKTALVGIRAIEVKDQFHFFINGQSLYLKGNNYAPSLLFLSEVTPELVARDVEMFQTAHYNMVRVHAHIGSPHFYDAADRGGVLLFQDGPFQGGYARSILPEAVKQTKAYVNLLYSHPSIALWSAHTEPGSAPGVAGPAGRGEILGQGKPEWNYGVLAPAMADAVKSLDKTRPVNLAGGMPCCDTHLDFGWRGPAADSFARWAEEAARKNPRALKFVTEFGAQSFPGYERTVQMLDADRIDKMPRRKMKEEFIWGQADMDRRVSPLGYKDLRSYVDATQDYQARLLKYQIERLRIMKYDYNYGVICFMHNDSRPAISWSVVDFWREPKKAFQTVADSFSPVWPMALFQFAPYKVGDKIELPLFVANDNPEFYSATLTAVITRPGVKSFENSWRVKLEPDMKTIPVDKLSFAAKEPGDYELRLSLSGSAFPAPIRNVIVLKVENK